MRLLLLYNQRIKSSAPQFLCASTPASPVAQQMAAAATSFSTSLSGPASSGKAVNPSPKATTVALNVGFLSSSCRSLKELKASAAGNGVALGGGSALGARMVSAPAIKPLTSLDFETSVFKKERTNLAGHEEVYTEAQLVPQMYCNINRCDILPHPISRKKLLFSGSLLVKKELPTSLFM